MKIQKLLCVLISAAVLALSLSALPISAQVTPSDELLAYITFDEDDVQNSAFTATVGGTVTKHGTTYLVQSYKPEAGNALSITSKSASNYLELAEGLLQGKNAATYSFWLKTSAGALPNWTFMTTNEDTHTLNTEKYLGMSATTESFVMERYNNTTTRISSVSAPSSDEWQYVTAVFAPDSSKLYINGRLAASDAKSVDVAGLLTENSKTWIGHANWGSGEGFSGMIDDFRIYGKALDDAEVAELSAEAKQLETEKIVGSRNCLEISTQFTKGGAKVFQIASGETVTFKTTVTNYTTLPCTAAVDVIRCDSEGNALESGSASEPIALDPLDSREFSGEITGSEETAYYKVNVRGISAEKTTDYDGGYLPVSSVVFPDASPEDSFGTTAFAHDPTIFKDPKSGKYFSYSTHNSIAESTDLIHWTSTNYNSMITVPQSNKDFVADPDFAGGVTANATYWAPDIYYKEGDDHPYWFYISTATNGDARDSVIGLVKSDSPRIWDGDWIDCGVVVASTKASGSPTNCIDANIFTDTDGKTYFIWGSFWRGIHMAELDTETGYVKGVDRTSVASTLATSNTVGRRMFCTPKGIAGPEGAFMIYNEDTGYRYMFTSYGWLGTNYNIRVARSDKPFSEEGSALLDYNGIDVGTTYGAQSDVSKFCGYKMSGSFQLGDGIEYVGSGHNSVMKDSDGSWYLVQHGRKVADSFAFLQVKKMLWTKDGWPVISPLVYAGEKEQTVPEQMLYGTWDLSTVGHTIFDKGVSSVNTSGAYKGTDLPVHSSQIILKSDGTLGNGLGTWSFDGDHTVTVSFYRDGDASNYEFYRFGDTLTLYALTGYDKDKRESALVLTGTDKSGIASFAKKNNASAADTKTPPENVSVEQPHLTDGGKLEFTLNNAPMRRKITVYAAEYDSDGLILQAKSKKVNIDSDAQKIEIDFSRKNADSEVFVLLWDDMKPITGKIPVGSSDTQ